MAEVIASTNSLLSAVAAWSPRRWAAAALGSFAVALAIGLPTDVIPNPVFGRPVAVTWWAYPTLVITAVLSGLLFATYVRDSGVPAPVDGAVDAEVDRPGQVGGFAGLVSFFAVGCPVCNKVVLLALGTTGARQWFEPFQPLLAVASIGLLAYALRARIRSATSCALPQGRVPVANG